ncbi:MAG: thioredoxin family protein [Planctomycetaceae bacterium]|nr:thioredoxin family protein [Planctomycetaceae bacterium]
MSRISIIHCTAMLACIAVLGSQSVFAAGAHWQTDYEQAKKQAIAESKPIVAMFTASWCGPCKKMKASTLVDRSVKQLIESHFVAVMIDTDRNRDLTRRFKISAMPTVLIIDPVTGEIDRVRGFQSRNKFLSLLNANKKTLQLVSASSQGHNSEDLTDSRGKGLLTPYCLVDVVRHGKLIKGNSSHSITKGAFTAHFSSEQNKKDFLKNPQKYWPQYDGACPVMAAHSNRLVKGEARWAVEYDNKLFFCHTEAHALEFIESPAKYAEKKITVSQVTPGSTIR